ncbi:hypothetical protein M408DRAFT_118709 [Serendipita vermifera MAFF 305830]|uniref:Nephrocystin 3-like N-terminal domain-containing protein n=1 Tax=Serendipita vermifera MAFF 305830 TaxID=933852 RepID=A0A0C2WTV7_SERVB|nr:hypothetical protein M408DRAFT_118709 [Serendipita vermifera MAFF 305830]
MEQAGVVQKDAPKESSLTRIGKFANRFLNANSDEDDIIAYNAELNAIVGEVQTALTIYIAIVATRIDRKADNLKALIFLEGSRSVREQGQLGTKHRSCLQNTRVDILEEIRLWNDTDGDLKPVYCIGDVAGTGKSTIAYTMANEWGPGQCFNFFFSNTSSHDASTLCISLAKQIIGCCDGADWDEYWAGLSSELASQASQNVENLWEKLVSQPFGKCTKHRCHVLVVDALDECEKDTRTRLLKCALKACTSKSQPQLRLLLTTRTENDIRDVLEMEEFYDAIVFKSLRNSETSREDIARYVEYRLNEDKATGLKPEQRNQLVDRCNGLFIFAFHACNLVKKERPKDQLLVLGEILAECTSLDALYRRALSQVGNLSKRVRVRLMDILRVILVAREPLSIKTIALFLSEEADDVNDIVKDLGSILGSSAVDNPVYILHATLTEFLHREVLIEEKMDPETGDTQEKKIQNQYYINKTDSERVLVMGCLSNVMAKELMFNICRLETSCLLNEEFTDMGDRISKYISKSLQYSCLHWADHLESATWNADILDSFTYFLNGQFLFWLEVLSVTKRVGLASKMLAIIIKWMRKNNQNDGMAIEMARFVGTFASVIAQSAPHIYLSALPFAPENSSLSEHYMKLYPRTLAVKSGGFHDWPTSQTVLFGHTDEVFCAKFSPDGKRVVSCSGDKTVRVWDAETGEAVGAPFQGHSDSVKSVAFSPDGKRITSGSHDNTVRVWDAETGEAVGAPFQGHSDWVWSVAFSPDGKRIVSSSGDKTIRVWDAETGQAIGKPFQGHNGAVMAVAFSSNGKRIVSGSEDKSIRIWDTVTGQLVCAPFQGHSDSVWSVAFSPDGERIVSGSDDTTLRMWDAKTGQVVGAPLQIGIGRVNSVAFSPDGKRIVSSSVGMRVQVWNAKTGKAVGLPLQGHNQWVWSISFSHDSKRVISSSRDKTIRIWDAETEEVVETPLKSHSGSVMSVVFSQDGKHIVSGSSDQTVRVWDAETGQAVGAPFQGHSHWVWSIACSPDGKRIVSGSNDKTVRVWDAESGLAVGAPFEGHSLSVLSVAFSPDGKRVVSGSVDRTVRVWDAETGQMIGAPFQGHQKWVQSVAFSPNGKIIVSGSSDQTVRIWDAESGQAVGAPLQGHSDSVWSVALSPDGKRIVSGSDDNTVRVWDLDTGQAVGTPFQGHSDRVRSVAFSPDGKYIASGSRDRTVRVWDADSGKVIGTPFRGHCDCFLSVAFSPDGKQVVCSSGDKTIQVWNVEIPQVAGMHLQGHSGSTPSVPFSPDGERIVSKNKTLWARDDKNGELPRVSLSYKLEDGWILDSNSQRLFWVSPQILPGLIAGGVALIIAPFVVTTVNLSIFVYGESWVQCGKRRETDDSGSDIS